MHASASFEAHRQLRGFVSHVRKNGGTRDRRARPFRRRSRAPCSSPRRRRDRCATDEQRERPNTTTGVLVIPLSRLLQFGVHSQKPRIGRRGRSRGGGRLVPVLISQPPGESSDDGDGHQKDQAGDPGHGGRQARIGHPRLPPGRLRPRRGGPYRAVQGVDQPACAGARLAHTFGTSSEDPHSSDVRLPGGRLHVLRNPRPSGGWPCDRSPRSIRSGTI